MFFSQKRSNCFASSWLGGLIHSWEKRTKKYLHPDLLIIDDFGLAAMTQAQAEDFYEIISERHLNSSV